MADFFMRGRMGGMKTAVFFHGQYVFRTLNGTVAVVSGLLPSTIFIAVAAYILSKDAEWLTIVVAAIFAAVALVFGGAGLWALWGWVRNRCVQVEINENGIIYGNRFWPWDRVRSFAGTRYDNGVCLEFTPRWTGVWGGGGLATTPLLTDEQYIELAREVSRCISARFPHVVVAMHPLKATAKS
jgi:hypothetical protein